MARGSSSLLRRLIRQLRSRLGFVSMAGRGVVVLAVVSLTAAEYAGMGELRLIAVLCGVLLALGLLWVLVPVRARGVIDLHPSHTVAGETGAGELRLTNPGPLVVGAPLMRIPIGPAKSGRAPQAASVDQVVRLPRMRRGETARASFEVPDLPRGVLPVGPATTLRSDPLGLFVRRSSWAPARELWVRPAMVSLEELGQGFVRDLEGLASNQVSMSDLAFHALREYVVGDDLRHVHWRSSARAGELHVRQYHETRRNHLVFLVDDDPSSYDTPKAFELALSITASMIVRAALEEHDLSFLCGVERFTGTARDMLDACCVVQLSDAGQGAEEPQSADLLTQARLGAELAPDASQLVLVTGSERPTELVRAAGRVFPDEVVLLGIRAVPGQGSAAGGAAAEQAGPARRDELLTVPELRQLPHLLTTHVRALARG